MGGEDERDLAQPGVEIVDHRFRRAQPHQPRHQPVAGLRQPQQMREQHDEGDEAREPRIGRAHRRAGALVGGGEQREHAEQQQPGIGGEEQEPDLDRERDPVAALALAHRAPVVQQDHRPQRHGQRDRPEVRRRHREGRDADHQQHRQRRVLRADDRAAEREHRPVGHHHADLRQQVDAEQAVAGGDIGAFRQPERQRRPEIGAELQLVADREHERHVAGRPGIEQRRHQRPQRRLRQRGDPHRQRRTRAQKLDKNGNVKHGPRGRSTHAIPNGG